MSWFDRWHHRLNGHEFEQSSGVEDGQETISKSWKQFMQLNIKNKKEEEEEDDDNGQGSLACCSPWGCKESDTTEQLS